MTVIDLAEAWRKHDKICVMITRHLSSLLQPSCSLIGRMLCSLGVNAIFLTGTDILLHSMCVCFIWCQCHLACCSWQSALIHVFDYSVSVIKRAVFDMKPDNRCDVMLVQWLPTEFFGAASITPLCMDVVIIRGQRCYSLSLQVAWQHVCYDDVATTI